MSAENEMVRYHIDSVNMNLSKLQEIVEDTGTYRVIVHVVTKNGTQLSN